MKIACKQSNICIKSNVPKFKYRFKEADVPIEVEDEHTEKILLNSDFYKSDKKIATVPEKVKKSVPKKKTWKEELEENFTEEEVKLVLEEFKTRGLLLEALDKLKEIPFNQKLRAKIAEVFIH